MVADLFVDADTRLEQRRRRHNLEDAGGGRHRLEGQTTAAVARGVLSDRNDAAGVRFHHDDGAVGRLTLLQHCVDLCFDVSIACRGAAAGGDLVELLGDLCGHLRCQR